MDTQPTAFGVLLRRFRGRSGLTQESLAARAGLSLQTITKLERGVHRTPRPETVQVLARSLHLAPRERVHFERAALRPLVTPSPRHAATFTHAVSAVLRALASLDLEDHPPLVDVFVSACPDEVAGPAAGTVRVTIL